MFIFLFYDHLVEIECSKSLNSGKHILFNRIQGKKKKKDEEKSAGSVDIIATT